MFGLNSDINNGAQQQKRTRSVCRRWWTRGREGRGLGKGRPRTRAAMPDEIRVRIIDHVLVHDIIKREAGQCVQPNFSRYLVILIVHMVTETHSRTGISTPSNGCKFFLFFVWMWVQECSDILNKYYFPAIQQCFGFVYVVCNHCWLVFIHWLVLCGFWP